MIHLRSLKSDDAYGMLEWLNDSEINQNFTFEGRKHDLESVLKFIEAAIKTETHRHYAIVDEQDSYIGTISLKDIDLKNGHAEYAIAIRRSYHGRGVGQIASKLVFDVAKDELNLHKIYLNVLTNNTAAIHLYEKLGFKRKGLYEDHILKQDGYHDLYYYEIIFSEDRP